MAQSIITSNTNTFHWGQSKRRVPYGRHSSRCTPLWAPFFVLAEGWNAPMAAADDQLPPQLLNLHYYDDQWWTSDCGLNSCCSACVLFLHSLYFLCKEEGCSCHGARNRRSSCERHLTAFDLPMKNAGSTALFATQEKGYNWIPPDCFGSALNPPPANDSAEMFHRFIDWLCVDDGGFPTGRKS